MTLSQIDNRAPLTFGQPARAVNAVCPYCGVGCALTYHVRDGAILRATGRSESPVNRGRLCVKGRYGFDYQSHPDRLTVPLIRRPDYPKRLDGAAASANGHVRPARYPNPREAFREATWEEALGLCARTFLRVKAESGPGALAGFGSAKCSNEDNYLFQKLVRAGFGTNNVDHCTRLCHSSSVAALMEMIGTGAVSNPFNDVAYADAAIIIGSNPTENHPVAATFFKQAAERGMELIVLDPRRPGIADQATLYLQFKPGTDVALLNGIGHVLIAEGLIDRDFIAARTEGFEAYAAAVARYTPEVASRLCGVPAEGIVEASRRYGRARNAMIFWGMGISQHTTGTDNSRALIALALLTGHIGRRGTGLHPLRGQNNVQGASDVGLIPNVYSGYQSVADPAIREKFERAWGRPLDPKPGLTVVEIMQAAHEGRIRAMLMMGENPFLSDPNQEHVRECLAALEFLAVQDIFLTETAEYADVILPGTTCAEKTGTYTNTNRRVQLSHRAVDPPGGVRVDWEIVADLGRRLGLPMDYVDAEAIWEEIRALTPDVAGITYERLERECGVTWPCLSPDDPGQEVIHTETFPRGLGRFVPVEYAPANELPDADYPFVLNTGRVLEHWHTGTMTRRARALDALQPEAFVEVNPADLRRLGAADGDMLRVRSRRGRIELKARAAERVPPGSVFIPFHFREAAANALTNDALDPVAKIPEFKFCAVAIEPLAPRQFAAVGADESAVTPTTAAQREPLRAD